MRIGLFIPCFMDTFAPEVGIAILELLERLGHEVVYPRDQTCCGQPMAKNGPTAPEAISSIALRAGGGAAQHHFRTWLRT